MEDKTIRIEDIKEPEVKAPDNMEPAGENSLENAPETTPENAAENAPVEDDRKVVVKFKKVTKKYKLYKNDKDRFRGLFRKKVEYKEKKALNKLSFTIRQGDSVAFLGRNGAGKSTLLKIVTGVAFPTSGEVYVDGKVSALLELGAGFDVQATGRDNIYLRCSLMGMTNDEIKEVEQQIVDFADLDEYIDQPVRSYSSGMKARLGFAINVNAEPDILIVDEALSVGDKEFKQKCIAKINEIMADESVTLLFVTHALGTAREFCTRGIVLEKGKKKFEGDIDEAIAFYEAR